MLVPQKVFLLSKLPIIIRAPYAPISIIMPRPKPTKSVRCNNHRSNKNNRSNRKNNKRVRDKAKVVRVLFGFFRPGSTGYLPNNKSVNLQETLGKTWPETRKIVCENGKWVPKEIAKQNYELRWWAELLLARPKATARILLLAKAVALWSTGKCLAEMVA